MALSFDLHAPDFLVTQEGVLTRRQALTVVSRHELYRRVRIGVWSSPATGVFVTHNGPLTPTQRDWVALLSAPPGSVLGGLTALSHDDFDAFRHDDDLPIVITKMGASPNAYEDIDQHWSTFSTPETSTRCARHRAPGRPGASSTPRRGRRMNDGRGPSSSPLRRRVSCRRRPFARRSPGGAPAATGH